MLAISQLRPVESAPDLRAELAAAGRILVIDDNERAAELTQRALSPHFHSVERTSDPLEALARIEAAAFAGAPYHALVVDLLMPKMDGLTLLRKLGERGPAAVLNTASTMAADVMELESEAGSRPELLTILVQHKTGSALSALQGKIDRAVALDRSSPGAAGEFFRTFNPRQREREPGVEEVHNFCEEARNLGRELRVIVKNLTDEHRLNETRWWQQGAETKNAGARIEADLQLLERTGTSTVWKSTPGATYSAMHDLQLVMALHLSPPTLSDLPEFKQNARAGELLRMWDEAVQSYTGICDGLRHGFDKLHRPKFTLEEFLPSVWPAAFETPECSSTGEGERKAAVIEDPQRRIRNFLGELFKLHAELAAATPGYEAGSNFQFILEEWREGEELDLRRRLARLECGSYWQIDLSADNVNLETAFAKLVPALAVLRAHKEAEFEVSPVGDRSFFSLYLNAGAATVNLDDVERRRCEELLRKKPDGSFMIPRDRSGHGMWVREGLGTDGNAVLLQNSPDNMAGEAHFGPIIYFHENLVIYADARGHALSARSVVNYIRHVRNSAANADDAWNSSEASERVYNDSVRVKRSEDGEFYLNCWRGDENGLRARAALEQLGVPAEKIFAATSEFCPGLDGSWWANERRIDPENT